MKDISFIIVTYNSAEDITPCISSLNDHAVGLDKEILVVDNASVDGTAALVEERFPSVRVMRNDENRGFASAINLGSASAGGRYLFLINPDSVLTDDGLREAIIFMDGNPGVGAAGCKIVNPDASIQLSCRSFPSYGTIFFSRYSLLSRLFPNNRFSREFLLTDWKHEEARPVDWVSGAAMVLRREAVESVGGFDEDFFLFIEDIDLCKRLRERGWDIYYIPFPTVLHHIGKSSDKVRMRSIYHHHRSILLYYRKHHGRPAANAFLSLGLAVRAALLMASSLLFGAKKKY